MANLTYYTKGTCSTQIDIVTNGDIIENVTFYGGCNGNLQGISILVKGMKIDEAIKNWKASPAALNPPLAPTNWQKLSSNCANTLYISHRCFCVEPHLLPCRIMVVSDNLIIK